ncbi:MAG: ABC transporter ATP-binding protein/permease [Acholeplasmatales bacterium]|nr:ABC transporter ATP-binding protein/permease [Acholeplasmatales bacterium]
MLELKKIVKDYKVADTYVHALKGISLNFRDNEFVSILGPSGCGKTTTLNIIGGLDKYTEGDLVINGVSTKTFKDRDWDVYRNHRIGFIFQSYNLIPHQNILSNVELALTIAGVSKEERVARAKQALDRVGLKDQYYKKPNQLSGGQCQRVAIARALVNNPDILLADEPTGALDTVTSVQIMELIKEISSEKLVIMVTHNPDLAEKYSTRIVKLLDGEVLEDSNPLSDEEVENLKSSPIVEQPKEASVFEEVESQTEDEKEIEAESKNNDNKEKAKMSLWTAIKLSGKNLYSKLKRTIMVVVAGSIGIIGVSTVLSVSQGVRDYIDGIQDDLLSGNPISISEKTIDLDTVTSLMNTSNNVEYVKKGDYVGVDSLLQYVALNQDKFQKLLQNNAINEDYIRYLKSMPKEYYSAIEFNYGIDFTASIYTDYNVSNGTEAPRASQEKINELKGLKQNISIEGITKQYYSMLSMNEEASQYASTLSGLVNPLSQCIDDNDYIRKQYNLVAGNMPKNPEDILVVVDSDRRLEDITLSQLGYLSQNESQALIYEASAKFNETEKSGDKTKAAAYRKAYENTNLIKKKFEYDELLDQEGESRFIWYPNNLIYSNINDDNSRIYNSKSDNWESGTVAEAIQANGTKGIKLNVCGIVQPKKNVNYGALSSGFLYSEDLARATVKINKNSDIAQAITRDVSPLEIDKINYEYQFNDCKLNVENESDFCTVTSYKSGDINKKLDPKSDGSAYDETNETDVAKYKYSYVSLSNSQTSSMIASMIAAYGQGEKTYAFNENTVGASFIPININVYPNNFDDKDLVIDYLKDWNDEEKQLKIYNWDVETFNGLASLDSNGYNENGHHVDSDGYYTLEFAERSEIRFNDPAELIISIINSVINIITYALVAFTALSLVVSTVMVGIITYVSVVERTNEIGVIRSLGGRKKDVSHLFNAESIIIGLASGIFGIIVTGIISLFANILVTQVSDGTITAIAHLTPQNMITMILVSVILTAISGIIPARAAAKKDPVDALRTA